MSGTAARRAAAMIKQSATSAVVTSHDSAPAAATSSASDGCRGNTAHVHTMRNAQVPSSVAAAGSTAWPAPRRQPAGIS